MKNIFLFLSFLVLLSCSKSELTLENLANEPIKFAKKRIQPRTKEFSMLIPKNWSWKHETFNDNRILLGIEAGSPEDTSGYFDVLSVIKHKSFGNVQNIKSECDFLMKQASSQNLSYTILESGKTDIFNYPAYFIHYSQNTGTYGELESIEFILESPEPGIFYHLTAGVSRVEDIDINFPMIVQSLMTFELTP